MPAAVSNIVLSVATQTFAGEAFSPTWDASSLSASLIYLATPSDAGNGSFTKPDGNNEYAGDTPVLTDGTFGTIDYVVSGNHDSLTCIGSDAGAGNFVTYTLTASANGYDITNIMSGGGWNDNGRDQQAYTVYYSTVASPTNFIPLAVVNYNPVNPVGISTTRATITPATGVLAANVAAVKFDMTSPAGKNGYEGYSELAVYGLPSGPLYKAPAVSSISRSGVNLIVTGTNGYPANSSYTWLVTTNLSAPITWTTNSTGALDGTGSFSNTIPINPSQKASFFRLRLP